METVLPHLAATPSPRNESSRRCRFLAVLLGGLIVTPVLSAEAPGDKHRPSAQQSATDRVHEIHGKWTLVCLPRNGKRICAVRQIQSSRQTGRPVLMIELRATADGSAKGGVMLPAGMRREAGVRVVLDGNMAGQPLPIRDCSEKGCAVTVTFAGAAYEKLLQGRFLQFMAVGSDGAPQTYAVDLTGFTQAADRGVQLERDEN